MNSDKNKPIEEVDMIGLTPEQAKSVLDALSIPAKIEAEKHRKRREEHKKDGGGYLLGIG